MDYQDIIVFNLKKLIKEKGITQKRLASMVDISENVISKWIKKVYIPSVDNLNKIAVKFNLPISYFFTEYDNEESCEYIDEELFDEVFYYAYKFADKEKLQIHGKLFLACYQSTKLVLKDNPKMSVEKAFNSVTPILLKLVKNNNI